MKATLLNSFLAVSLPLASGFPAAIFEAAEKDPGLLARYENEMKRQASADGATFIFENPPRFNAQAQYINVSKGSGHEFVPPGSGDLRGPCPGLNAFANHSKQSNTLMSTVLTKS
jgi:hypothetical protein